MVNTWERFPHSGVDSWDWWYCATCVGTRWSPFLCSQTVPVAKIHKKRNMRLTKKIITVWKRTKQSKSFFFVWCPSPEKRSDSIFGFSFFSPFRVRYCAQGRKRIFYFLPLPTTATRNDIVRNPLRRRPRWRSRHADKKKRNGKWGKLFH